MYPSDGVPKHEQNWKKKSNSCLHFLSQWESNCRPYGQFLFYGKRQHIAQQINLSRPRNFLLLVRSALIWRNFCVCGWKTAKVAARVIWSCCCKPKVKTSSSLASAFLQPRSFYGAAEKKNGRAHVINSSIWCVQLGRRKRVVCNFVRAAHTDSPHEDLLRSYFLNPWLTLLYLTRLDVKCQKPAWFLGRTVFSLTFPGLESHTKCAPCRERNKEIPAFYLWEVRGSGKSRQSTETWAMQLLTFWKLS